MLPRFRGPFRFALPVAAALTVVTACATLGIGLVAPRFELADDRPSDFRLLGPSFERPLGGASIRLYTRVENPNPVGITLSRLRGTLQLEGLDAAEADFPLGLPLQAYEATVVPLDLSVDFADIPGLGDVARRALSTGEVRYTLRGIAVVEAGALGQPSFGPMTILEGALRVVP